MKILYSSDKLRIPHIGDICKGLHYVNYNKGGDIHSQIVVTNLGKRISQLLAIKTIRQEHDKELDVVLSWLDKPFSAINLLFVQIYSIVNCRGINHYFMQFSNGGDLLMWGKYLNKGLSHHLLLQCLFALYCLNHQCGIFHNDVYFKGNIRNFMIHHTTESTYVKIEGLPKLELNSGIRVRLIDFGWSSTQPGLRTKQYMPLVFPDAPFFSEVALFAYYFYNSISSTKATKVLVKLKSIIKESRGDRRRCDSNIILWLHQKQNKIA
jgi:hypothetical protein